MVADIKRKIEFLEIVDGGEESILSYFDKLSSAEERKKFYNLVSWGASSDCTVGLNVLEDKLFCTDPRLTGLGKTVYEGRKDLIFK